MIVHECKAVFVHIPKTAGVSMTHSIMSYYTGFDTSGQIGHLSKELKERFSVRNAQKHKQGRFFVSDGDLTQTQWNEYYKFAFCRNPWDRLVSEFHWRHSLEKRKPSENFSEFIDYCEFRLKDTTNKANDIYWTHAQTQKSYVTSIDGNIIIDEILKFEDLPDNMNNLAKRLKIPIEIQKHNTSTHKHYREYYTDEQRDKVAELYKDDLEMFNYEF